MQTANEAIEKIPSPPTHDADMRFHLGQKIFLKRAGPLQESNQLGTYRTHTGPTTHGISMHWRLN
jgi:hypothetical protein